jgi:DNA primase
MQKVEKHYQGELRRHQPAADYLQARAIDGATAKRFGIGYAPSGWSHLLDKFGTSKEAIERLLAVGLIIRKDNGKHYDRFRERIMFPIRDSRGRCIGFGGRVMGQEEPKYLNSPETVLFHKGRELYGLYEARQAIRHIERLVVVEGYMDVVALARHGIDFAAATLGTATSDEHLNRLFRLSDEVHFCFDGDRAGRAAAWRALETALPQIREGRQIRFVFLPDGQDPDSYVQTDGADGFEKAMDQALALSDYLVEELASQVDMKSVDGRARLAELAKPLISKIPPGVYKELLIERLAESVGLAAPKLAAILAKDQSTPKPRANREGLSELRHQSKPSAGKPSIVRRAISLLLNNPDAADKLDVEQLAGVSRPGTELLRDLIETVQAEPTMTTARLLERWRSHEEGRHLGKLAAVELPVSDDFDASAELEQCIAQLALAGKRDRVDFLIEKERLNSLSDAERSELRQLGQGSTISG